MEKDGPRLSGKLRNGHGVFVDAHNQGFNHPGEHWHWRLKWVDPTATLWAGWEEGERKMHVLNTDAWSSMSLMDLGFIHTLF